MAGAWHAMSPDEVRLALRTHLEHGLDRVEAAQRLAEVGLNALEDARPVSPWRILFAQFTDFMVLVLLGATLISFLLGEVGDGITIVAIVVMNAILGFFQEYRAERSVAALRQLSAPTARVIRSGERKVIPADELVPGDLIELEAGDRVPADGRLVETRSLAVDESALTGESNPAAKRVDAIPDVALALGDRVNLVFMGTVVTRGRGRAVVAATGMHTEMGAIAHLIRSAGDDETPLQRRLEQLGQILVALSVLIVAGVVVTGLLRGEPLYQMFLTGVSLAVAAIPEGLPAIVTVALALGVQRMIQAHAVVRRLPAVETLGCTTVICSDKTGTLTKNQMTVTDLWVGGTSLIRPEGTAAFEAPPDAQEGVDALLRAAALCNNASLTDGDQGTGDPTELALLAAARDHGIRLDELTSAWRREAEIPFESERQRMAVVVRNCKNQREAFVKGSWDSLAPRCRFLWWQGKLEPLTGPRKKIVDRAQERLADQALRVLAVAYRPLAPQDEEERCEQDLILIGLVGLIDPPRPEATRALAAAARAGVRTVMITGDHPHTARAIAGRMAMIDPGDLVVTGPELDRMSDTDLDALLPRIRVFARVSPPHKLRVVRAFKRAGEVVAMTGDGVNDAPAVKEADIGVAMGRSGTDVTKEASAMILTDDNYATIVAAIREGRAIYDNIRKFIRYLLSCNVGEVLVMFLAAFIGLPLPLLPIQILFVNLVTDGLPALALGVDPPDPRVMDRPPRPPRESIFARGLGTRIGFRGILIGVSSLLVFAWGMGPLALSLREARTLALATLVMSQLFHVFDARTEDRSFLEVGLLSNPWAVLAVLSSIVMLTVIIYLPALSALFKTAPLGVSDWVIVCFASGFIQIAAALRDLVTRPARRRLSVRSG